MPSLIDEMNYEYENPTVSLNVHEKVAKLLEQHIERHVNAGFNKPQEDIIDQIILYASMSKENKGGKLEKQISDDFERIKENSLSASKTK